MKLHRIELIVVDFESFEVEDILVDIKQSCEQLIRCVSTTTVDVGDDYWNDNNIINSNLSTPEEVIAEFERASQNHI